MRTRSGKEGTNARALAFVYDRVRCERGKQVSRQAASRQRTRNYRRGYIPCVILAEPRSRNFAPAPARPTDTSYDVFYSGTQDCASSFPPRPLSARPLAPLKGPYRTAKSGDYPRTIVPLFTSRRVRQNVSDSATRHLLVIAKVVLPPASLVTLSSSWSLS